MSDHERGAYTPPTDAPLSFDARQPVRGTRPIPITLIVSILVLAGLAAAIFVFYRSGVRQAGQPPQTVGEPIGGLKAAPPAESQPQDPAAGLQIYHSESGAQSPAAPPQFTPPPEQPQPRTQPVAPPVALAPAAPAAPPAPAAAAPALRPSIISPTTLAASAGAPPSPAPAKIVPAEPKAAARPAPPPTPAAPAAKAEGAAAVQIGAFSSQALADKGWNDAAAVAPGAAAGKGKNVEKVDKDGKTLFRTQVTGFASRAAAVAFCDKLKAAGKACFVK